MVDTPLVTFDEFKKAVVNMTSQISSQEIDCAFIFLSRGGIPFNQVEQMSEAQLLQSLRGFPPSITKKIFNDSTIVEESNSQMTSSEHGKQVRINLIGDSSNETGRTKRSNNEEAPCTPYLGLKPSPEKKEPSPEAPKTSFTDLAKRQWKIIGA